MTLTECIKIAVSKDKRSQRQLAFAAKISPTSLCRFISGRRGMTMQAMDRLAMEVGVTCSVRNANNHGG
jgi:hypothetical protein